MSSTSSFLFYLLVFCCCYFETGSRCSPGQELVFVPLALASLALSTPGLRPPYLSHHAASLGLLSPCFLWPPTPAPNNIWNTARTCSYKLLLVLASRILEYSAELLPWLAPMPKYPRLQSYLLEGCPGSGGGAPPCPTSQNVTPHRSLCFLCSLGHSLPQTLSRCVCFLSLGLDHMIDPH